MWLGDLSPPREIRRPYPQKGPGKMGNFEGNSFYKRTQKKKKRTEENPHHGRRHERKRGEYANKDSLTQSTPSTSDPPRQLYIFLHNRHSLCMNRQQVAVLEQMYEIGFSCFLKSLNGC